MHFHHYIKISFVFNFYTLISTLEPKDAWQISLLSLPLSILTFITIHCSSWLKISTITKHLRAIKTLVWWLVFSKNKTKKDVVKIHCMVYNSPRIKTVLIQTTRKQICPEINKIISPYWHLFQLILNTQQEIKWAVKMNIFAGSRQV